MSKCIDCTFADGVYESRICRRLPPQVLKPARGIAVGSWPVVGPNDWCGEFRVKPLLGQVGLPIKEDS